MSRIHPESGCRLPPVSRTDLDKRGRAAYDRQLGPAFGSLVGLRGPSGIRLHSPAVAQSTQALVQYFRTECELDAQVREIAILVTADRARA